MTMDPIVIDPPDFDQKAAWKECSDFVDECGGLSLSDGSPNWRAAFGADPGICSCPACGHHYWMWGRVQRCRDCGFEYPTDWWPMYSWGAQQLRSKRMHHPYFKYGYEHPVADPWAERGKPEWRDAIRKAMEDRRAT